MTLRAGAINVRAFYAYDENFVKLTGKSANFSATVYKDGATPAPSVTVTFAEIGTSGWYEASIPLSSHATEAEWIIEVGNTTDVWNGPLAITDRAIPDGLTAQEKLDVNTEADTALTDYDPPTKTEMDTMETNLTALLSRVLGLARENTVIDDIVHGVDGMTTAVFWQYDTKANATVHDKSTGLLRKWTATTDYTGGNMSLHRLVLEP